MIEALLQAERLLVHGQVDQAEQIYLGAIEQDPRNAIAVVGLARVALERGDDALAWQRARSALEIDPQNAAALRLEARLGEVITAREQAAAPAQVAAPASGARAPDEAAPPSEEAERPSEQAFFTRNPSMAEHQRMEEQRTLPPPAEDSPGPDSQQRPGLLRRILGR